MASAYWNKIQQYWYFWSVNQPGGRLFLKFEDGSSTQININNDSKLQGIVDTLRNEKPCYWNMTYTAIGPLWEDVGEGEK